MLKLIEYTPAAKQRNFDPRNSAVNFETASTPYSNSKSEYSANKLLARTVANSKRYA